MARNVIYSVVTCKLECVLYLLTYPTTQLSPQKLAPFFSPLGCVSWAGKLIFCLEWKRSLLWFLLHSIAMPLLFRQLRAGRGSFDFVSLFFTSEVLWIIFLNGFHVLLIKFTFLRTVLLSAGCSWSICSYFTALETDSFQNHRSNLGDQASAAEKGE